MRIVSENCVGIVIDLQEKLVPHMVESESIIKRNSILIQGLQILEVPIMVTEQYTRGLGYTINPIKSLIPAANPIEKISFSCCDEPLFNEHFKWFERSFVLISGIEAHVCVLQTVEDFISQDIQPVVIEDCISSRKESDKRIAVSRMERSGAIISSSESILFELCRFAGNERFKAISALVK